MLKQLKYLVALAAVISMASCHKNDITLLVRQVNTHTTDDLNSIYFVNDSVGYICGGSRWVSGIVTRTTDGGKTWSSAVPVIGNALYAMNFFSAQEGLLGGFYGKLVYTNDSAHTFTVSQFNELAITHFSFINRQRGVASCGVAFRSGAVYTTQDGGTNWTLAYLDSMHAFNGAAYIDDTTSVVCGYGTILRSVNGGASYTVSRENGDIYQEVKYINGSCYAVGYQGEVIKSIDKGITWHIMKGGNGVFSTPDHFLGVDFIDENTGYAVGESGLMMKTSNGGVDWHKVKAFTGEKLKAVHLFSATSGIVVGAGGRAYLFQQ